MLQLPAYTQELEPAKRLWPSLHEPVANRAFANVAALESVQITRCAQLTAQQAAVIAFTNNRQQQ